MKALPRKLREAWLEGKWDIFQGQFFQEFTDDPEHYRDRRFTHVIEPFDIPREWKVYRSYDFGYAKPFSCAWWAVDFDGCIYRILELYGCTENPDEGVRWTPEKQFSKIREIEQTHPWLKGRRIDRVADPAIWDTSRGRASMRQRRGTESTLPRETTGVSPDGCRCTTGWPLTRRDILRCMYSGGAGIYPDHPESDVFRHGAGGSGHPAGGSRGGREPVFLHVGRYDRCGGRRSWPWWTTR